MLATASHTIFRDEEIFSPKSKAFSQNNLIPWYWHYCITKQNEAQFSKHFDELVNEPLSLENVPKTQVLSEPLGLFSTEWFASRYQADVLMVVRHPANFVSSILRLGWKYDFGEWLAQEELMKRYLVRFKTELNNYPSSKDILGQAILLWRVFYTVVRELELQYPDWKIVTLEELSRDPVAEFKKLFEQFGLEFTENSEQMILSHTKAGNTVGAPVQGGDDHRRDSKKMVSIWKDRLDLEAVKRVKEETRDVWCNWYTESDWR
jgi:hypothetical protein